METERKRRKRKRKESKRLNDLMRLLFFAYIGFMIWILFVQRMESTNGIVLEGGYSLNIIPFKTIKVYFDAIHSTTSSFAIRQLFVALAANVVLFIPLGFFLPCIWKKLRSFFKAAGVIVAAVISMIFYSIRPARCLVILSGKHFGKKTVNKHFRPPEHRLVREVLLCIFA